MVEESVFRGVVGFLAKIGVYDIILPFLLVFTIVFAILEKTKILGTDTVEGVKISKKNLNSMVAFVMAFLVIASTKLVAIINEVMANVVLLIILAVCFLMLIGTFFGDEEFTIDKIKGWKTAMITIMFLGIVVIFLNALGWLEYIFALFKHWKSEWAASILFMIIVVGFIVFITWEKKPGREEKKE